MTRVTVSLRVPGTTDVTYEAEFVVDTGATDCVAPASKLNAAGVRPVGSMTYQLALTFDDATGSDVAVDRGAAGPPADVPAPVAPPPAPVLAAPVVEELVNEW